MDLFEQVELWKDEYEEGKASLNRSLFLCDKRNRTFLSLSNKRKRLSYTLNLFSELRLPDNIGFALDFVKMIKEYQQANKIIIYKKWSNFYINNTSRYGIEESILINLFSKRFLFGSH